MPLRHRHTGVGLSISSQWLMAFLTVYAGPIAISHIGWKTWIWFTVFNFLGFPYGKLVVLTHDHDLPELMKAYFSLFLYFRDQRQNPRERQRTLRQEQCSRPYA